MEDRQAKRIASEALRIRAEYPRATALEILDQVFEGSSGADLDFTDAALAHGDHTDPRTPFGQLLAEAFDDVMNPAEWRNILQQAVEPDLLLEFWHREIIATRFAQRYGLWGAEPDGGPATVPAVFDASPANQGQPLPAERIRSARWPF